MNRIFRRRQPRITDYLPVLFLGVVIGFGVLFLANSRTGSNVMGFIRNRVQEMKEETYQTAQRLKRENEILNDTLSKTHPL